MAFYGATLKSLQSVLLSRAGAVLKLPGTPWYLRGLRSRLERYGGLLHQSSNHKTTWQAMQTSLFALQTLQGPSAVPMAPATFSTQQMIYDFSQEAGN